MRTLERSHGEDGTLFPPPFPFGMVTGHQGSHFSSQLASRRVAIVFDNSLNIVKNTRPAPPRLVFFQTAVRPPSLFATFYFISQTVPRFFHRTPMWSTVPDYTSIVNTRTNPLRACTERTAFVLCITV